MADLVTRTRACDSLDKNIYSVLTLISKETYIPRGRLIDQAILKYIKENFKDYYDKYLDD